MVLKLTLLCDIQILGFIIARNVTLCKIVDLEQKRQAAILKKHETEEMLMKLGKPIPPVRPNPLFPLSGPAALEGRRNTSKKMCASFRLPLASQPILDFPHHVLTMDISINGVNHAHVVVTGLRVMSYSKDPVAVDVVVHKLAPLTAASKIVSGVMMGGSMAVRVSNFKIHDGIEREGNGVGWLHEVLEVMAFDYEMDEVRKQTGGILRGIFKDFRQGMKDGDERDIIMKKVIEGVTKRALTGLNWVAAEFDRMAGTGTATGFADEPFDNSSKLENELFGDDDTLNHSSNFTVKGHVHSVSNHTATKLIHAQ
jgi:hypothetical protein